MAKLSTRQRQAMLGCIGGGTVLLFFCCGGLTLLGLVTPKSPEQSRPPQPATPLLSAAVNEDDGRPFLADSKTLAHTPLTVAELPVAGITFPAVEHTESLESTEAVTPATPTPIVTDESKQTTDVRTWTDNAGAFRIVAAFVSATDTQVTLRNEAGSDKTIPIAKLSEADQAYVAYTTAKKHDPSAKLIIGYTSDVLDGDTLKINDLYGEPWTIRLAGIDTPESNQPYGLDATMALRRKVINKVCQIEWKEQDRYRRTLGHVYVDGHYVNQELVEEGWAWHYKKYSTDQRLADAETAARIAKLGLWQDSQQIAPWDWRNGVRIETVKPVDAPSIRTTDTVVYITKTGSKYHRSGCQSLSKSKISIPLSRAQSAYEACSKCNPP